MIAIIFATTLVGLALGVLLMAIGNRKVSPAIARERWKKLLVYFVIVQITIACAAAGSISLFILLTVVITLAAAELWRATSLSAFSSWRKKALSWSVFIALAAITLCMVPLLPASSWVFLYLLIAVFDGFSQVTGQLAGRHRLAPTLSPGKTVGGALGGLLATLLVAVWVRELVCASPATSLLLASGIASAGLAGDLAASWIKRQAGIKDFGTILPGQGGVLDRYDSFLGAGAVMAPFMLMFTYQCSPVT